MTEQSGPFFIEWGVNCLVVRSKKKFSGTLSMEVEAEQQSAIFALPPMGFQEGMNLVLHAEGHEDVVIDGRAKEEHE